jgi:hypothetical protein
MADQGPDSLQALRQPPSEILPFLYLGSAANAANKKQLRELGVTHILNMKECHYASEPEVRFAFDCFLTRTNFCFDCRISNSST